MVHQTLESSSGTYRSMQLCMELAMLWHRKYL